MTINHLIAKDYFFVNSFKDSKDNIILNVWDDIKNYTEEYPVNNVLLETLHPITILKNQIEETFTMEDIVDSELTTKHKSYSINQKLFPISLDVNNIYYFVDTKDKFNLLYLNEDKLFSLNSSFKISDKEKEFSINEDNKLILKISSKQSIELTSIIGSEYIIENNDIILLKGLNLNSLDFNLENNEDENIVADYFTIDTFNNIYVVLNGKYNIIENGKLKKTTEKSIESILYYIDEDYSKNLLSEYTFESGVNSFEKLTLQDLERIIWGIADIIREKSELGGFEGYSSVAIPFITLKRILDLKEEWLNNEILNSNNRTYQSNLYMNNLSKEEQIIKTIIDSIQDREVFKLKDGFENWHLLTWEDIVSFQDVQDSFERDLKLSKYDIVIKTRAKNVIEFLEEYISHLHDNFQNIFKEYEFINIIKNPNKLDYQWTLTIINKLNDYSFNYKNANADIFHEAYMYLLEKFQSGSGKKGGEFFTPLKLSRALIPFLDMEIPENGSIQIADPTAGSFSFLTETFEYLNNKTEDKNNLNKKIKLIGQELNAKSFQSGKVNLLFKGINNYDVFQANTIIKYNENIGKYKNKIDFILANPPFGSGIDYGFDYAQKHSGESRWQYGIPNKGDGDYAFLLTVIDLLTNNKGKAGIILPLGTLFKDTTKHIREKLLNNDLIESIVLLPSDMFQTTNIAVSFWIINKNKKEEDKGKVFMINASDEFIKEGKFNVFQPEKSLHNYLNRVEEEGLSGHIETSKIINENDCNLSIPRYVFKDEPEEIIDIVELNKDIINLNDNIISKQIEMNSILFKIMNLGN